MWTLPKSPERLAQEIIGKERHMAEAHLRKYGAGHLDAILAVMRVLGTEGTVINDLGAVADAIYEECRED